MMILAQIQAAELSDKLRMSLLPVTFVWCVIGLWDVIWKQGIEVKTLLGAIFRVLIAAILVWQYPTFIVEGRKALDGFRKEVFLKTGENKFQEVLTAKVEEQPASLDFSGQICSALIHALKSFGQLMLSVLLFLQTFCLEGMIAVSPILLGFLAWDLTRPMGIQFCFTTLGVLLWEVGVLIVDVLLLGLGEQFLEPTLKASATIGAAGVITGVLSWPLLLGAMVIAALMPAFLYLSVPFIMATVLRGGDPTGPLLLKAMQMGAMVFGGAGMMIAKGQAVTGISSPLLGNLPDNALPRGGAQSRPTVRPLEAVNGNSTPSFAAGHPEKVKGVEASNRPIAQLGTAFPESFTGGDTGVSGASSHALERSHGSPSASAAVGDSPAFGSAFPRLSTEQRPRNKKSGSNGDEVYIGSKGHVFQRLTDTRFSCKNPHTGFTSKHDGDVSVEAVRNGSLLLHCRERMKAGDIRKQGKLK